MSAYQTFQKALLVLDRMNDSERGVALLEEASRLAEVEDNLEILVASYAARCEVLYEIGRHDDCLNLIREIDELCIPDYLDDVLDYELSIIKNLKIALSGD